MQNLRRLFELLWYLAFQWGQLTELLIKPVRKGMTLLLFSWFQAAVKAEDSCSVWLWPHTCGWQHRHMDHQDASTGCGHAQKLPQTGLVLDRHHGDIVSWTTFSGVAQRSLSRLLRILVICAWDDRNLPVLSKEWHRVYYYLRLKHRIHQPPTDQGKAWKCFFEDLLKPSQLGRKWLLAHWEVPQPWLYPLPTKPVQGGSLEETSGGWLWSIWSCCVHRRWKKWSLPLFMAEAGRLCTWSWRI